MDKKLLLESIDQVKKGIEISKDNIRKSQHQLEEGEAILKLFQDKLKSFK